MTDMPDEIWIKSLEHGDVYLTERYIRADQRDIPSAAALHVIRDVLEAQDELDVEIARLRGDLEASVQEVLAAGLSTGHADTYAELVTELIAEALMFRGKLEQANQAIESAPCCQGEDAICYWNRGTPIEGCWKSKIK